MTAAKSKLGAALRRTAVVALLISAPSLGWGQANAPAPLPPAAQQALDKGIIAAKVPDYLLAIRFFEEARKLAPLGACPNSRCSILIESDSILFYEQVFSPLEYRSEAASAAECARLRAEGPCFAVYR